MTPEPSAESSIDRLLPVLWFTMLTTEGRTWAAAWIIRSYGSAACAVCAPPPPPLPVALANGNEAGCVMKLNSMTVTMELITELITATFTVELIPVRDLRGLLQRSRPRALPPGRMI
ncbi:hypothetical protein D3C76_1503130 [compost metagenome]